jgi:hypothetical protein
MLYTSPWAGVKPTKLVVIGTDWIGSVKSNYHMIAATTAPPVAVGRLVKPLYYSIKDYRQSIKKVFKQNL